MTYYGCIVGEMAKGVKRQAREEVKQGKTLRRKSQSSRDPVEHKLYLIFVSS